MIHAMHDLAEAYGAEICVEGIETGEQCEIVKKCGAETIQGYYFSKPVPCGEFPTQFIDTE